MKSVELRFLLPVAGYTLLDQKRRTDMRSKLKTFSLTERIERQNLKLYEHVLEMITNRLSIILLNYKHRGHRSIGRPKAWWEDMFSWSRKKVNGLYPLRRRKRSPDYDVKILSLNRDAGPLCAWSAMLLRSSLISALAGQNQTNCFSR
jgi:hypothetical protein